MTDKELLEAAAKAIGYTIFDWYGDRFTAHDGEKLVGWNPLTDDGDDLDRHIDAAMTPNSELKAGVSPSILSAGLGAGG